MVLHHARALEFIDVSRTNWCGSHGKAGLTSRIKGTTSDDDFDVSIAMIGHGTDRLGESIGMSTELRERRNSRYSNKTQVGTESREVNEFGVETRDTTRHVLFMAVFVKMNIIECHTTV